MRSGPIILYSVVKANGYEELGKSLEKFSETLFNFISQCSVTLRDMIVNGKDILDDSELRRLGGIIDSGVSPFPPRCVGLDGDKYLILDNENIELPINPTPPNEDIRSVVTKTLLDPAFNKSKLTPEILLRTIDILQGTEAAIKAKYERVAKDLESLSNVSFEDSLATATKNNPDLKVNHDIAKEKWKVIMSTVKACMRILPNPSRMLNDYIDILNFLVEDSVSEGESEAPAETPAN